MPRRDAGALPRDRRERWRAAASWPPADGATPLHLDAGGALTPGPAADGADDHVLDLSASTGELTRWRASSSPRRRRHTPATEEPARPTSRRRSRTGSRSQGLPACLEAGADRANVFSYLDEIRPDGSAVYITEGCAAVS